MVIPPLLYPGDHPGCNDGKCNDSDDMKEDEWEVPNALLDAKLPSFYENLIQLFTFFGRFAHPPNPAQATRLREELDTWLAEAPLGQTAPPTAPSVALSSGGATASASSHSGEAVEQPGVKTRSAGQRHQRSGQPDKQPASQLPGTSPSPLSAGGPGHRHPHRHTASGRRDHSQRPRGATHRHPRRRPGAARQVASEGRRSGAFPKHSPIRTRSHLTFTPRGATSLDVGIVGAGASVAVSTRSAPSRVLPRPTRKPGRVGGGFTVRVSKPSPVPVRVLPNRWGRGLGSFCSVLSRCVLCASHVEPGLEITAQAEPCWWEEAVCYSSKRPASSTGTRRR